jgi:YD repeat-containing protein
MKPHFTLTLALGLLALPHLGDAKDTVLTILETTLPSGKSGPLGTVTLSETGAQQPMQARWAFQSGATERGVGLILPGSNIMAASFGPGAAAMAIYKRSTSGKSLEAIWSLCDTSTQTASYTLGRGANDSEFLFPNDGGKMLLTKGEEDTYKVTWTLPTGTYTGIAVADGDSLAAISVIPGSKAGIALYTTDKAQGLARSRWTEVGAEGAGTESMTLAGGPERLAAAGKSSTHAVTETPANGSSSTGAGGTTFRDKDGRIMGSSSTSGGDTTTYRDGNGRITGSSSVGVSGDTTQRDGKGRITVRHSTTEGTSGDTNTTYRDGDGRILGWKYVSPAGNITYRDADGRIINGPKW